MQGKPGLNDHVDQAEKVEHAKSSGPLYGKARKQSDKYELCIRYGASNKLVLGLYPWLQIMIRPSSASMANLASVV